MDWEISGWELVGYGVVFVMALGCGSGGLELMPHLSPSSSESPCAPGQGSCSGDEVCVYNPWVIREKEVDLNGYVAWQGSECGAAPDDEGVCVVRPHPDSGTYPDGRRKVCGCNRETYDTVAEAHAEGVSIDYYEKCRPVPDHIDESGSSFDLCDVGAGSCPAGETCLIEPFMEDTDSVPPKYDSAAATFCEESTDRFPRKKAGERRDYDETFEPEGHGFCVEVESGAGSQTYASDGGQVCGCDGTTYQSASNAHAAGTSIGKRQSCDTSSGKFCKPDVIECNLPSEFCKLDPGEDCDGATSGKCTVPPESCPTDDDPVCGCDGVTYRNECVAHKNMVAVEGAGMCP